MAKHTKIAAPKKAKAKPKPKAKPRKSQTKKAKAPKPDDESDLSVGDKFELAIVRQLDETREMCKSISETREAGDASPALARELANLNRSMASLSAEHRQRESHVVKQVERLTPEDTHRFVAEYLRELEYDGRQIFREILIELDGERSLFS